MAASLAGLAIGLVLCELWLRAAGYGSAGRPVFSSRYGTIGEASWLRRLEDASGEVLEVGDSVVPVAKPAGETRLLFLGDSGTQGVGVRPEQAYPRQLEQRLQRAFPDRAIRVINAGAVGMSTIGEYYLLRDELLALEPDVVVLGLFLANDINFNMGHLEWDDGAPQTLTERLARNSALVRLVWRWQQRPGEAAGPWNVPAHVPRRLIGGHGLHVLSYPGGEIATYMREPSKLVQRAFVRLRGVLERFQALAAASDFAFSVLLIPSPSSAAGRLRLLHAPNMLRELAEHGIRIDEKELDVTLPTTRIRKMCAELSIPCIDPTERVRRQGRAAFFPDDQHPTVAGHRALSDGLMEEMTRWWPEVGAGAREQ